MKSIFKIIGNLWALAFISFVAIKFYASSGNELPEIAILYASKFEGFLSAFLTSSWFFVVFIAMWLAISFHISKSSGWAKLAEKYSANYPHKDQLNFKTITAVFDEQAFRNVLKCAVNSNGVYLKITFPFNFGFKKLFIPWHAISTVEQEQDKRTESSLSLVNKFLDTIPIEKRYFIRLNMYPEQIIKLEEKEFNLIKSEFPAHILGGK